MLREQQILDGRLTTVEYLSIVSAVLLVAWLIQYHWKRRKLYRISASRKSPPALPIIGHAHYLLGSNQDYLETFIKAVSLYESPVPIWLGPMLFINIDKPEHLEKVLKSPHALKKSNLYEHLRPTLGHGLITAPVDKWKKNRKIIAPTFNQKLLDTFVEVFLRQSDVLVTQLEKRIGQGEFDVFDYMGRFALDSVCENAMGTLVNAQTTECDFARWNNRALEICFQRILYHYNFIFFCTQMYWELKDINQKIHTYVDKVVDGKIQNHKRQLKHNKENEEFYFEPNKNSRMTTFLEQLIEFCYTKGELTSEELRDEVITMTSAGSDTTASVMSFMMILLGMYPEIQNEAYHEIVNVLGPDRSLEVDDLPKLKYVEMIIKESMRLFPVGPILLRDVTSDIPLTGDFVIPGGSSAMIGIFQMHRNATLWPDPMRFDPKRFLPEECAKRHPYSYLPFSGGPRNCLGAKYAMMALKTVTASILRKFKVRSKYQTVEDIKLKVDVVLKAVDGYMIELELRDGVCV